MANLKEIQDTLNNNPEESKKFHADPVGYLEGKGLILPEAAKEHLNNNVKGKTPSGKPMNVGIMYG